MALDDRTRGELHLKRTEKESRSKKFLVSRRRRRNEVRYGKSFSLVIRPRKDAHILLLPFVLFYCCPVICYLHVVQDTTDSLALFRDDLMRKKADPSFLAANFDPFVHSASPNADDAESHRLTDNVASRPGGGLTQQEVVF